MSKPAPMPLDDVLKRIIRPCFANILPGRFDSLPAVVGLLAIGLHESEFRWRDQVTAGSPVIGPATSFWQFEKMGGVAGVLRHEATHLHARAVCVLRGVTPTPTEVWRRMVDDDLLGCAFARFLLFTDPKPLPAWDAEQAWFDYYLRNWRPGAWDRGGASQRQHLRERWSSEFARAKEAALVSIGVVKA